MDTSWVLDEVGAQTHSRGHARILSPGCEHRLACRCDPPDWVRCDHVDETGNRCAGGSGHLHEHRVSRTRVAA